MSLAGFYMRCAGSLHEGQKEGMFSFLPPRGVQNGEKAGI